MANVTLITKVIMDIEIMELKYCTGLPKRISRMQQTPHPKGNTHAFLF